ncbi:MAG: hypothetical protein P3X23_005250 [Thermosynechococcus sp. Uc]|uniref:hypothetical protein n=1 Tax=Thermosynechococcus sp. Uc TaxID=3034853 RepID=UPI0019F27E7A|nr:hypothetical protein [Thermosynechococcus sp. Uc]MDM7326510.1 hypothetical protein [Thermosynechococcus sp. Uc]HIK24698.1 hypothetical protein [Thermosynechococcus sp. M46_R2017_013]
MDEKLKRLEDKIDAVEGKLQQQIDAIEAKLEQRLIQLGQRIDTVESTLEEISQRQAGTDARLWGFW